MPGVRHHQLSLSAAPADNSGLFSTHWLEHRLPDEPEWTDPGVRQRAESALDQLAAVWATVRPQVEHFTSEAELEDEFVRPALDALGWSYLIQRPLRHRKPDYALFLDAAARTAAQQLDAKDPAFWQRPALLADAKRWDLPLDQKTQTDTRRELPHEQIEWYLDRSHLDYAMLTNGRQWRLIPRVLRPEQKRLQTYFSYDLPAILDRWSDSNRLIKSDTLDDFLHFYLFFSPVGYRETPDGRLIDRAIAGSSAYRLGVSEGLKARVFDALGLCIEGFLANEQNGLTPNPETLAVVREHSFTLLYRLLFILYAEDRLLLPIESNRLYRDNRSLRRHRREIASELDRPGPDSFGEETGLYDDLRTLFDLVDRGHGRYGVPAYNGGLFEASSHQFLDDHTLPDRYTAQVIDRLSRAMHPENPAAGHVFVDYRDLAIQHLGTIYEGLLELRPRYADQPMVVARKRSRGREVDKVVPADDVPAGFDPTDERYDAGRVYLETDKGERRASGSYYTPDPIVKHIVEHTLGPLCKQISESLTAEIADAEAAVKKARGRNRADLQAGLDRLRGAYDDRVLRLRVLDPAMGSGHFLLAACQHLALEIATHEHTADPDAQTLQGDEPLITFWKRRVAEQCLYGVDLNPMAVELAKLALWLETVAADQPLTFLDHHLRPGNSLVGGWVADLDALPDAKPLQQVSYENQFVHRLAALLKPLREIHDLPSDTAEQVKRKESLYRDTFRRTAEPFFAAADLWVATFFAPEDDQPTAVQYQRAIREMAKPKRWAAVTQEDWFAPALAAGHRDDVRAFHWELEFPEVFFDDTGRKEDAGFDAVIGNPPYDVLSSKELGRDISDLQRFIERQPAYDPSRVGKNNLYKLFICQALRLLPPEGRLGFITPMAVLGDLSASGVRGALLDRGGFTGIEAFPQKDDPTRRVFPEAKLSTTIFSYRKTSVGDGHNQPFRARVHPGRNIEADSPALELTTAAIPLYDPTNRTIVSCSQADWNLATRIMASRRMQRLGEVAEFFQGEVNETVQRRNGNLVVDGEGGKLVTRGAAVCLYVTRPASQGSDLYLDTERFLDGVSEDSKAYHHRHPRVVWQESSPQNNFRRIIAAQLPAGEFYNHTINYAPEHSAGVELSLITAVLNSKLADWYFRLGSTNAHVSHYQVSNLPMPVFADTTNADQSIAEQATAARRRGELDGVFEVLRSHLAEPPFPAAAREVIMDLVKRIAQIEAGRGAIARSERSSLAAEAQPYQDLIDRLLYAMAGLTDAEAAGLERRLSEML